MGNFWSGSGSSTVQELKDMYPFIDDKVKEFLLIDKIMETLEIKFKYGRKNPQFVANVAQTHSELKMFTAIDAHRAATSQETFVKLAEVCEKFAATCRSVAQ